MAPLHEATGADIIYSQHYDLPSWLSVWGAWRLCFCLFTISRLGRIQFHLFHHLSGIINDDTAWFANKEKVASGRDQAGLFELWWVHKISVPNTLSLIRSQHVHSVMPGMRVALFRVSSVDRLKNNTTIFCMKTARLSIVSSEDTSQPHYETRTNMSWS